MDRDVAQLLLSKLTAVNTALQTLVTNTAPSNEYRSTEDMRNVPDPEEQETRTVEPEPEPETKK